VKTFGTLALKLHGFFLKYPPNPLSRASRCRCSRRKRAGVIVIEKRQTAGGNTALAGGMFAAESPAQKRINIDARRDELI
jgi:hypothetical protein